MDILGLPFNRLVGLELTQHNGAETVCLNANSQHNNHVGTVHAAALYSLAEASSGHALIKQFDLDPKTVFVVLRSSAVKYRKAATGRLVGIANIEEEAKQKFLRTLQAKGRGTLSIQVKILDPDLEEVFVGDFSWFASNIVIADGLRSGEK